MKAVKKIKRKIVSSSDSESEAEVNVVYEETDVSLEDFEEDEIVDEADVQIGRFILICEGKGKRNMKNFCVGQVKEVLDNEVVVSYFKRINPYFKFIETNETYNYLKQDIEKVLPAPVRTGGTKRTDETFSFNVDLTHYKLGLK